MQIAYSKTREQFPLSSKKIIKKTLANTIVWMILFGAAIIFFLIMGVAAGSVMAEPVFIGLALFFIVLLLIIILLTYIYQKWYYAVYFYDLTDDFIIIKKGPITPREITIPYERIQDVYVDQDLLDRFFGLYDVHLSSATISSGMEAHIDGVEKESADGLKTMLLQTVQQRISKNKGLNIPANNMINQNV